MKIIKSDRDLYLKYIAPDWDHHGKRWQVHNGSFDQEPAMQAIAEARRQALEEAAKVAEDCTLKLSLAPGLADGASIARNQIAQAIRALASDALLDRQGNGKEGV